MSESWGEGKAPAVPAVLAPMLTDPEGLKRIICLHHFLNGWLINPIRDTNCEKMWKLMQIPAPLIINCLSLHVPSLPPLETTVFYIHGGHVALQLPPLPTLTKYFQ